MGWRMASRLASNYNRDVQASTTPTPRRPHQEPLFIGTCCGLASAVGYTAANACLRAVADCDPVWVSCVKAVPTVLLFGPVVLLSLIRRRESLPPWRQMRALIVAALVCQLFGNVVFQWSLGSIGMALAVPLTLGAMISGAAVMGRLVLHESVTVPMACSLLMLVAAAFVLSLGAGEASKAREQDVRAGERAEAPLNARDAKAVVRRPQSDAQFPIPSASVLAGVGAACMAGFAYALLGVVIRSVVTNAMSVSMTMVVVTLTGVVSLGLGSLISPGLDSVLNTAPADFWFMALAGLFNAVAFLALTKSLQLVPVAHVNALNASQAAMGALAGVLLFAEPSSWALWLGVAMTAVGLLMMRRPARGSRSGSGE